MENTQSKNIEQNLIEEIISCIKDREDELNRPILSRDIQEILKENFKPYLFGYKEKLSLEMKLIKEQLKDTNPFPIRFDGNSKLQTLYNVFGEEEIKKIQKE